MESHADILFIGEDNTLSVGKWKDGIINSQNILYFKFGGVVGFTAPISGTAWHQSLIRFNPMSTNHNITAYDGNISPGNPGNINTVPCYQQNRHSPATTNVSDPATYHTDSNLKYGWGDPCRLVGLKADEVRPMSGTVIAAYRSGWRLPNNQDNINFVRASGPVVFDADMRYWDPYEGQEGGWFPIPGGRTEITGRVARNQNPNGFLPALGGYYPSGSGNNQPGTFEDDINNRGGYYWSGDVTPEAGNGHVLMFNGTSLVFESDAGNLSSLYNRAYPVRCVREPGVPFNDPYDVSIDVDWIPGGNIGGTGGQGDVEL
jgi:hypothetical protein